MRALALFLALPFAPVACASASDAASPAHAADTITRAVYANDYDATLANFDDATKKTITRTDLGELSDRMHALGDLQTLRPRNSDPDSGRYEYDAAFTGGKLLVQLRIDPSGKIGAYRIVPEGTPAAGAPSPQGG